jgi:hypothetical protein
MFSTASSCASFSSCVQIERARCSTASRARLKIACSPAGIAATSDSAGWASACANSANQRTRSRTCLGFSPHSRANLCQSLASRQSPPLFRRSPVRASARVAHRACSNAPVGGHWLRAFLAGGKLSTTGCAPERVCDEFLQSKVARFASFLPGSKLSARLFHGKAGGGSQFPTVPVWSLETMCNFDV